MLSLIHLLLIFINVSFGYEKVHNNEFAVHIPGGINHANMIAGKYGFINKGQIGSLKDYYRFLHNRIEKRSLTENLLYSSLLENDTSVLWWEQQTIKVRVKRNGYEFEDYDYVDGLGWENMNFKDPLYVDQWYLHGGYGEGNGMNVIHAWKLGYTGKGVVVSILDDGIQRNHPDLLQNYDKDASWDINDSDDDPTPQDNNGNKHGTRCAGEVAAVAGNEFCGVGIAYNASIGGVRMLDGAVSDAIEAAALSLRPDHIDIYSASWGPDDGGKALDGPGRLAKMAFQEGIEKGRRGLGSIFVWASGNGGRYNDSCNCDGYANSIYTISVSSATESGLMPWYLEQCSSTLTTTYSSGSTKDDHDIVTVDVDYSYFEDLKRGSEPALHKLCTKSHTGSSASAPIAAAVCALALEANPNLTWRDLQYIIVLTSRYEPLAKENGWFINGVNRKVSLKFGYGLMDATEMVLLAKDWNSLPNQHICQKTVDHPTRLIPLKGYLESSLVTDGCESSEDNHVKFLEHVQVRITLSFYPRGNLRITLISPSGTHSPVLLPRPLDIVESNFYDWPFTSVHFWGEHGDGTWRLRIENSGIRKKAVYGGTLTSWSIVLYGTATRPPYFWSFHVNDSLTSELDEVHERDIKNELEQGGFVGDSRKKKPIVCGPNHLLRSTSSDQFECVKDCPAGEYGDLGDSTCYSCDKSCSFCYGPSYNNCLSCTKYFLSKNICSKSCPVEHYTNKKTHLCHPCLPNCASCLFGEKSCDLCKAGFYLFKKKCLPSCPVGTFIYDNSCQLCNDSCTSCYGPNSSDCISCPATFFMHNGSCVQECPTNFYPNKDFVCIRCHRSCEFCVNNTSCVKCQMNWKKISSDICEYDSICNKGWNKQGDCEKCFDNQCEKCSGPQYSDCIGCKVGQMFLHGKCVKHCPMGYFHDNDECVPCNNLCLSCENSNVCSSCKENLVLHRGRCVSFCPIGFFKAENGKCKECNNSCRHCIGNTSFNCTSCSDEFYLHNNFCLKKCPNGYYPKSYAEEHLCLPCLSNCKSCTKFGSFCTSCYENSTLVNGTCIPCLDNEYYDMQIKSCKRCHRRCGRCLGKSENECLSCSPPLRFDEINHKCLRCCENDSKLKIDCCNCRNDLDICLNNGHPRSIFVDNLFSNNEFQIPVKNIVPIVIVICASSVMLFVILFGILQAHSMGWFSFKVRKPQYERVPDNAAKFDYELEKFSVAQDDVEDDDIFQKI